MVVAIARPGHVRRRPEPSHLVTPTKAGFQIALTQERRDDDWIPAYAAMTKTGGEDSFA
jgi:hypothetical protein